MLKISETQKIGFKHVQSFNELTNFHFNSQPVNLRLVNYRGQIAQGATVAFMIENQNIVSFSVAVCSGAEEKFDKYEGKKKALTKLLELDQIDRSIRSLIWQKYFEAFGLPHS